MSTKKVFVGGIGATPDLALREHFSKFGMVTNIRSINHSHSIITFEQPSVAEQVILVKTHVVNGKKVDSVIWPISPKKNCTVQFVPYLETSI